MARYVPGFGEAVSDLLREAKLNPYQIARLADGKVSHQTIRNMAEGQATYSDHVIAVVEAVGKHLEWSLEERKDRANRLLVMIDSQARHFAGVTLPLRMQPGVGALVG